VDVVRFILFVCVLVAAAEWLVGWRRGENSVRDERGKLRPAAAIAAVFGAVFAFALAVTLFT
jgi:hypothetical protein